MLAQENYVLNFFWICAAVVLCAGGLVLHTYAEVKFPLVDGFHLLLPAALFITIYIILAFCFCKFFRINSPIIGQCIGGIGFGCILALTGILMLFNAKNDSSPAMFHECTVIKTDYGKGGYSIETPSWKSPQKYYWLKVSRADYHSTIPGMTKYEVETKKGNLGFEWVVSISRMDDEALQVSAFDRVDVRQ